MIGKPNREGFHTVTPYLMVVEVGPVVDFLEAAFGAEETYRTEGGSGGTHVEVKIGDSMVMLGGGNNTVDETLSASLFLYVEDVDAIFASAVEAGATELIAPADGMFNEKRGAGVKDPFGNDWYFGRHEKDD
jgi:PhnB protein